MQSSELERSAVQVISNNINAFSFTVEFQCHDLKKEPVISSTGSGLIRPVGFLANALGSFELEFQWLRIVTVVFMGIVEYGNGKRIFLAGVKLEVIVVSGIKFS